MMNKVVGDSIVFEVNLTDAGGTAITDAVGSLTVVDGAGSTVLATHAPHTSSGTYKRTDETTGWGRGPITSYWRFMNSSGTTSKGVTNQFRIVGTSSVQPYVFQNELKAYYENIEEYFDGSEDGHINDAVNEIDSKLEAMGYKLPIKLRPDGFYDQPLRDWNAYNAIVRIVSKRQASFNRDEERPWFKFYSEEAGSICSRFQNKEYNLDRDYSVAEAGIGIGTKTRGTSAGQMETNWRGGVGTGFTDSSFERDWTLVIIGTGTSGRVNECDFVWSNNDGQNYSGTYQTSYEWQHLQDGLFVRFNKGTGTIPTNVFDPLDRWRWKTFPKSQAVAGKRAARSY